MATSRKALEKKEMKLVPKAKKGAMKKIEKEEEKLERKAGKGR